MRKFGYWFTLVMMIFEASMIGLFLGAQFWDSVIIHSVGLFVQFVCHMVIRSTIYEEKE